MKATESTGTMCDYATTNISTLMTKAVHTIGVNDRVSDALRVMLDRVNALPVVDENGKCVGMISRSDLTEPLFAEDQELARLIASEGRPTPLAGSALDTCNDRYVRELMSDSITSIEEETTIRKACQLMSEHAIHHLPVVGKKGNVVGMVSSLDLIRWLAG